jgi:cobalamin biosynthesis protein CobW
VVGDEAPKPLEGSRGVPRRAGGRAIPALVVSGFLGSGKTTLVRRILADAQRSGVRVALVSNEFGELGIDQALLSPMRDDYVELRGGCVCCKLSDQLVETLQMLRERADPDRLVIETSGVALPYDTQLNFWRPPVEGWIEDDVAVVVVNAEQLAAGRDLVGTFEQQVSSADLLVLNKIDLVDEAELPRLEERLRELEPEAPILRAEHADLDPLLLFPPDPRGLRARRREAAAAPGHVHERFLAEELEVEPRVDPAALLARLEALGALRAKGFVETADGPRVVQGVGARIELEEPARPPPPGLAGRVVVIRRA